MRLVFLAGKARVGKTVLANAMAAWAYENGFYPRLIGFADAIRQASRDEGINREKEPDRYRLFCQKLGADKRAENPDYWVDRLRETIDDILAEENRALDGNMANWERAVIVDDCRFLNEVALCREYGGKLGLVTHGCRELEDHCGRWRYDESEVMANKSEAGDKDYIDMYDHVIRNDGTTQMFLQPKNFMRLLLYGEGDCPCELCVARRENRDPNPDEVWNQLLERKKNWDGDAD